MQAVHSGADLQASAKEASGVMPQGAKDHLGYVLGHQGDHEVLPLMQNAVEARTELAQSGQLAGNRCTRNHLHSDACRELFTSFDKPFFLACCSLGSYFGRFEPLLHVSITLPNPSESQGRPAVPECGAGEGCHYISSQPPTDMFNFLHRDLLYLDVALENVVRSAAERGSGAAGAHAGAMVGPLLQNLVLSVGDNEEMCYCLKAWQALPRDLRRGGYPSKEDALKVLPLPGSPPKFSAFWRSASIEAHSVP